MRKLGTALLFATVAAAGCEKIPGTADYQISQAKKAVADQLIDPTSPLFRKTRVNKTGSVVCGEYNAKNRNGAYTGFSTFVVSQGIMGRALLDPEYDQAYQKNLDQACTAARQASIYASRARAYGIAVPTMSDDQECGAATDYRSRLGEQVDFDKLWWRECYYDGKPPAGEKWLQD